MCKPHFYFLKVVYDIQGKCLANNFSGFFFKPYTFIRHICVSVFMKNHLGWCLQTPLSALIASILIVYSKIPLSRSWWDLGKTSRLSGCSRHPKFLVNLVSPGFMGTCICSNTNAQYLHSTQQLLLQFIVRNKYM
jgi:hypothetical protein